DYAVAKSNENGAVASREAKLVVSVAVPPITNGHPVLAAQSNRTIEELTQLLVNNTATAVDFPANALTYQLANPPAGARIDANGIITWTPLLAQSPSTNVFTTIATASVTNSNGILTLSTTNSFLVTVSGPYDGID